MTDETLRQKAGRYSALFGSSGVRPAACDFSIKGPEPFQIAAHCMWMCEQVPRLLVEGKKARASEWIRFVEGILWSMGAASFRDLSEGPAILGVG